MHDYREHRKIAFHAKLLEQSCYVIFDSEEVESASRYLHSTLHDRMNEKLPAKTVRMSTRNPPWLRLNATAQMDAQLILKKGLMRLLQKIVNHLHV